MNIYPQIIKPTVDRLTALLALLILSPLILLLWIGLAVANSGRPLFRQERPGKNGKIFTLVKFKTMNDKRGPDGQLLPDAERLTGIGKFVRRTSLDELPQLWNVLVGDMSIVGPRPLLVEYLPRYSERQRRRHEVKPGITGWAQVNGRNAISWEKKFEYDVWYVDHQNFWLDLKILWLTLVKVLQGRGIQQAGSATMEKFNGNVQS